MSSVSSSEDYKCYGIGNDEGSFRFKISTILFVQTGYIKTHGRTFPSHLGKIGTLSREGVIIDDDISGSLG